MSAKKPRFRNSAERQKALNVRTKVLRLRLKDKHAPLLLAQSREVNYIWNYTQELALKVLDREFRFISAYEVDAHTAGVTKEGLSLHSQTVQAVSAEYCTRRRQFKKRKLRWRGSNRKKSNYSLGWIPVKASALAYRNGQVHYQGVPLCLWDSYKLAQYTLRAGWFSEDSRGRWYLNVTVDVPLPEKSKGTSSLGIDLGLKDFLATSDSEKVEAQQFYRKEEKALASAQRANKKARTRAIHAKIANRRKDFLHKLSTRLAKEYGAIFVGDVSASKLAKTNQAKSVLDAGWSSFRTMLQYKCENAGVWFDEVDEAYSTQECHVCHTLAGPKGLEGLGVRQWQCPVCNTVHDRDVNSARIVKLRGLARMEIAISAAAAEVEAQALAKASAVNEDSVKKLAEAEAGHGLPTEGIPFQAA